jgi:hypothetical protein
VSGNIDFYFRFGERDARLDYQKGREDGEREIPSSDATSLSIHEKRFLNEADSAKNALKRALRAGLDTIESRLKRLDRHSPSGVPTDVKIA